MHHKHGKKDLVILSISTDEISPDDPARTAPKVIEEVRKFLKQYKAPFDTLILDEPQEVKDNKLHFNVAPCVFVFDRRGKWTQFVPDSPDIEAYTHKIEDYAVKLLSEK